MKKIRILLADDHNVRRQGIAQMLERQSDMTVVAQAKNGVEAITLIYQHRPTIALLDLNMPEINGIEATRRIILEFPETSVIILSIYSRDNCLLEAIKAGARGYLLKEAEIDDLLAAVRTVARGETVIDRAIAHQLLPWLRPGVTTPLKPAAEQILAERDIEILRLVARGLSNQEIASHLAISEKTVRNRLSHLFRRFQLKNRTEAALYALHEGWIEKE